MAKVKVTVESVCVVTRTIEVDEETVAKSQWLNRGDNGDPYEEVANARAEVIAEYQRSLSVTPLKVEDFEWSSSEFRVQDNEQLMFEME